MERASVYKRLDLSFDETMQLVQQEVDLNFDGPIQKVNKYYGNLRQRAAESGTQFLTRFLDLWVDITVLFQTQIQTHWSLSSLMRVSEFISEFCFSA